MHIARLLGGINSQTTAFWKALIMYLPLAHPNIVEYEQYWGTPDGKIFLNAASMTFFAYA